MAERDFKGVWIPKEIWLADDIGWSAKLLLVEIDSLAMNGECFASNDYLAQFFGLGKNRISKLISELRDKEYVEVELVYKSGTRQVEKRRITTRGYRRKCQEGIGEKYNTPIGENANTPIGENAKDINTGIINTSFINTEEKPAAPTPYDNTTFSSLMIAKVEEWLQYKKERREGYKPTGLKSLITQIQNNVNQYGETAVIGLIDECMGSGYRGIIFDRLQKSTPRTGGRREMVPGWAQDDRPRPNVEDKWAAREAAWNAAQKTAGNDPDLASRADALRQKIQGERP